MTIKSENLPANSTNYSAPTPDRRPRTVTVLGLLWCILGAFAVFFGLAALSIFANSQLINAYGFKEFLPIIITAICIVITIGIVSVFIGYGLLNAKRRIWKIAVAISLLYITSSIAMMFTLEQGWFVHISTLTLFNFIRLLVYTIAGVVLLTLLMRKSVREYFRIYYGSRRRIIISTCRIVTVVVAPTVITFFAYGYTTGIFAVDVIDNVDKTHVGQLYTLNNLGTSEWSVAADMPTARDETMAAVIEDRIYVVGGHLAITSTASSAVEIYDTRSKTWLVGKELPITLDHAAVAAYQGKLYVVGGFKTGYISSSSLLIFDPLTNEWTYGADMPTSRGALTAQFINGILYAVGGWNGVSLVVNEAYDPETNSWTSKAPMSTARDHLASGVIDGKLYVIGGRQGSLLTNQNINEQYDPISNKWAAKAPMLSHRGGLTAVSLSDSIYVIGGENPVRTFDNNEQYIPSLDMWIVREDMPTARHGLASAAVDGSIYVMGGSLKPGLVVSGKNEVFTPVDWKTTIIENINP